VSKSCETPQNLTLPSGTAQFGTHEYTVSTNSSPVDVLTLNDVPVRTVIGSLVYMQDVAYVRWIDGSTERLPCRRKTKRSVVSDEDIRIHSRYREGDPGRHAAHVKSGGAWGAFIRGVTCAAFASPKSGSCQHRSFKCSRPWRTRPRNQRALSELIGKYRRALHPRFLKYLLSATSPTKRRSG
jgi:hypothetical protein